MERGLGLVAAVQEDEAQEVCTDHCCCTLSTVILPQGHVLVPPLHELELVGQRPLLLPGHRGTRILVR